MDISDLITSVTSTATGVTALVMIAIVLWRDSSTSRRIERYTRALEAQVTALRRRVLILENALRAAGLPIPIPEPDHDLEGATP